MDLVVRALLASIAYFICFGGNWLFGQSMTERPIVVGFVTGLLLGDMKTGIIIGGSVEAIFMGSVNIGGNISAEPAAAAAFAVAFATMENVDAETALALAVPIGILAAFLFMIINNVLYNFTAPAIDRLAEMNNARGLIIMNFGLWFLRFLIVAICLFASILAGQATVQTFIENIPQVILSGLTLAGKFLPAVGLSILMKMLWSKQLAGYFFLGFILYVYFELPHIAIAAIATIIVVVVAMRDKEIFDLKKMKTSTIVIDEEEDFFA